jgi:hypothetical protein
VAAVPVVPLSDTLTVSFAAKPLPETVRRPPRFSVLGAIVKVAVAGLAVAVTVGFGVAVAFGVGVAVAFGFDVAVAVPVSVGVVVAVGVSVEVATAADACSVAALAPVIRTSVAPLAARLPISISAAKAALVR